MMYEQFMGNSMARCIEIIKGRYHKHVTDEFVDEYRTRTTQALQDSLETELCQNRGHACLTYFPDEFIRTTIARRMHPNGVVKAFNPISKMQLRSVKIFVICILSSIAILANERDAHGQPQISLKASTCSSGPLGGSNKLTSSWKNESELLVEKVITTNCAIGVTEGRFSLEGNTLTLFYDMIHVSPEPNLFAKCMCSLRLNYNLAPLEKKDYIIEIKEGTLTWKK